MASTGLLPPGKLGATVSTMETGSDHSPSGDAAEETLRQLERDEDVVRYPPLPRWFFSVMAAIVAGLALARLLPTPQAHLATSGLGAVSLVLASRHWLNRDGVSWASARFSDMAPFLGGVLGTFVLCWVVAETTTARWVWAGGAVVLAGLVLRTGHTYRREHGE
jgi:hypothetical protein